MKPNQLILLSILVGIICGFLSADVFLIGFWNLAFWGVTGVVLGLFSETKDMVIKSGIAYGFFLSMFFLLIGFHGASDKLGGFVIFSLALSIIGVIGGILSLSIGKWLRKYINLNTK